MRLPKIDMNSVCHPYPETTMFGAIELSAKKFPDAPAYDFMDKITTYEEFVALEPIKHLPPKSPNRLLRSLAWGLSVSELKKTHFKYKKIPSGIAYSVG